jgi:RNA polymerase II elongation factor ELL
LAKKARSAYENMGVPESDPGWDDIRPPDSGLSQTKVSSVDSRQSTALQDNITKPAKVDPPVKIKNTTTGQSEKAFKNNIYAEDDLDASAAKAGARRVPGSGFKMKAGSNTPPAELVADSGESSRKTNDARSTKADVSSSKSSHNASLLPTIPARDAGPHMNHTASNTRLPQSTREPPESLRPVALGRSKARASPTPVKRKKAQQDNERDASELEGPTSQKKRRIEEQAPQARQERDLSLPKKPAVREPSPPRSKQTKQDGRLLTSAHSPIPPASSPRLPSSKIPHHERAPSFSSNRSRDDTSLRGGSVKPRRRSPVFTSSEDEKDEPRPHIDAARRHDEQRNERLATTIKRKQTSLPDSPEVLKKMYNRKWLIYQSLRAQHCALVDEIQDLLRDDAEEIYLPEGDTGLPHPEELAKLRADLDRETSVLHEIIEKWEMLMLQGKTTEGPLAKPIDV